MSDWLQNLIALTIVGTVVFLFVRARYINRPEDEEAAGCHGCGASDSCSSAGQGCASGPVEPTGNR